MGASAVCSGLTLSHGWQEVEDKIRAINDELEDEMVKLDKEYSRRKQPLYDQRSKICAKIPNFWLNALLNHPNLQARPAPPRHRAATLRWLRRAAGRCPLTALRTDDFVRWLLCAQDYISSEDYELLRFLTSVDVKDIDDPASTGTRYTFTSAPGPSKAGGPRLGHALRISPYHRFSHPASGGSAPGPRGASNPQGAAGAASRRTPSSTTPSCTRSSSTARYVTPPHWRSRTQTLPKHGAGGHVTGLRRPTV